MLTMTLADTKTLIEALTVEIQGLRQALLDLAKERPSGLCWCSVQRLGEHDPECIAAKKAIGDS